MLFFLLTAPATPDIYTLSLHDALPISSRSHSISRSRSAPVPTVLHPRLSFTFAFCLLPFAFCLPLDRKSTRLNSSHVEISYAVFCLKKKNLKASPSRLLAGHLSNDRLF